MKKISNKYFQSMPLIKAIVVCAGCLCTLSAASCFPFVCTLTGDSLSIHGRVVFEDNLGNAVGLKIGGTVVVDGEVFDHGPPYLTSSVTGEDGRFDLVFTVLREGCDAPSPQYPVPDDFTLLIACTDSSTPVEREFQFTEEDIELFFVNEIGFKSIDLGTVMVPECEN